MNTLRFNILLIILTFSFGSVFSQTKDEKRITILRNIYSCSFDSAQTNIIAYISSYPNEPQGHFLHVLSDWWKINIDRKNVSLDDALNDKVNKCIDFCDAILDRNPKDVDALIFKGASLGYRGLAKSLRENWLSAADDGRQALNLLSEALEISPKNKEALLGVGIYNYFAEYIPDRYVFLKPLMLIFPKGDKVKGIEQIKEAETSILAGYEAKYIMAFFNMQYERNFIESEKYSKELYILFPSNPVFEKMLYNCYSGSGRYAEALEGWIKVRNKNLAKEIGFQYESVLREADYYISLSLLKLGRIEEMEIYINECESLSEKIDTEDTSFKIYTYVMQGMKNDILGNRGKAIDYYKKVLSSREFRNSHSEANRFINSPYQKP